MNSDVILSFFIIIIYGKRDGDRPSKILKEKK